MKTCKTLFIAIVILFAFFLLTSCQTVTDAVNEQLQGGIQTGTWSEDGKTFTNEWSNINLTLPDGFHALSPEELQAAVGAGEDVAVNNGDLKQSDIDASKLRSAYDFMITTDTGIPNAMLMYENLGIQPQLKNLDEAGYFDSMKTQLEAIEQMGYTAIGTSTKELAGEDWFVGTMSIADVAYQDYYIKKSDNIIITFCVTYTDDTNEMADTLIDKISKAK